MEGVSGWISDWIGWAFVKIFQANLRTTRCLGWATIPICCRCRLCLGLDHR